MLSLFRRAIRIYPMSSFLKFSKVGPLLQVHGTCESCKHHENRKNTSRYPQIMNASQLVAFVSVKENIQRANNVIIVYLERFTFVLVKENIQRANNVIIVYLET